jgi:putative hydrolase of the HAD superfamily
MRFADLDAVMVDGYGTLLQLADPVPPLRDALRRHGVELEPEAVRQAFLAEVSHYRPRAHLGRDETSLDRLRRECVAVFVETARADVDPAGFVDDFLGALRFEEVAGARTTLEILRTRGLRLAVVANWDISLHEQLDRLGLNGFDAVVTSAEARRPKPDPAPFRLALERLEVSADRALHVGDEDCDREGAAAAGLRFAAAPLATAFAGWS